MVVHPRSLAEIDALCFGVSSDYLNEMRESMEQIDYLPRAFRDLCNEFAGDMINEALAAYGMPEDRFMFDEMRKFLKRKHAERQAELLRQNHITASVGEAFRSALARMR